MKTLLDALVPCEADDWQCLAPGVFTARLFNDTQCSEMLTLLTAGEAYSSAPREQPNSMHDYGIVVADPALSSQLACLPATWLAPVIPKLFPHLPRSRLFGKHHAFMVSYGEDAEQDLSLHVDASHITLNICLATDAVGSEIHFTGARCALHVNTLPDSEAVRHRFEVGDAMLHVGNQRHYVAPLLKGRRQNLLVWYRLEGESCDHSNTWLQAVCPSCLS